MFKSVKRFRATVSALERRRTRELVLTEEKQDEIVARLQTDGHYTANGHFCVTTVRLYLNLYECTLVHEYFRHRSCGRGELCEVALFMRCLMEK